MAQRLRDLREATNLTYAQLSRRATYSPTALSMAAATGNATMPSWRKVHAFVTACDVTDPRELAQWRQDYDEAVEAVRRAAAESPLGDGPVPPAAVRTWTQFSAGLRTLREQADLSYQQLVDASSGVLAKSTVSDLLTGRIRSTETTVLAFLTCCQQRIPVDADAWLMALHRLQTGGEPVPHQPAGPPTPAADSGRARTPAQLGGLDGPSGRLHSAAPAAIPTASSVVDAMPRVATSQRAGISESPHDHPPADIVRELARQGLLTERIATASGAERTVLSGGAYHVVWPVVFNQLTRPIERRRGHHSCAASVNNLQPECLDRFEDDVEAVIEDLFQHAKVPIHNLEGWIASRLTRATIDAHRRRRGERGALMRPRLPRWLANGLGNDPWLTALALEMLTWVGIPATAGNEIWPWSAWTDHRSAATGSHRNTKADVVRDVDTVLTAMRRNQAWYENFIEKPLGRKQAPLLPAEGDDPDLSREPQYLTLTPQHESDNALLTEWAALMVEAIKVRIRRGEDPRSVVDDVLRTVFAPGTGAEHMDRLPGFDAAADQRVDALLADPGSVDHLVSEVLGILGHR